MQLTAVRLAAWGSGRDIKEFVMSLERLITPKDTTQQPAKMTDEQMDALRAFGVKIDD